MKGLKTKLIERDLRHEGPNVFITNEDLPQGMDLFRHLMIAPFNKPRGTEPGSAISLWSTVWIGILTLVGCLLYAILFLLTLDAQLSAPSGVSAFIVAAVSAVFMAGPMMWTHERDLRIHTQPAIPLALVATLDLGLVTALVTVAVMFGGFALGGWAVSSLGVANTLVDLTTVAVKPYWMVWLAVSIVAFVYIYNQKFEQHVESEIDNHQRATIWSALWHFGFLLALYNYGVRTLNSGLYLAAGIASAFVESGNIGSDAAFFFLVPTLACAATAVVLYLLASLLVRASNDWDNRVSYRRFLRRERGAPDDQDSGIDRSDAQIPGGYAMSSKVRRRKLDTGF